VIERKKVFFFWPSSLDTFLDSVKKEAQVCNCLERKKVTPIFVEGNGWRG